MTSNVTCNIYIGRPSETDWNRERKLQGHTDIALNDAGVKQAENLRDHLKHIPFYQAHSSDLSRAKVTATILFHGKEIEIVETEALRERYMGVWESRTIDELEEMMKQKDQKIHALQKEEYLVCKWHEDVESCAEIYKRLTDYIQSAIIPKLKTDTAMQGSSIYLSTHGGVVSSILYHHDFKDNLRWQVLKLCLCCIRSLSAWRS